MVRVLHNIKGYCALWNRPICFSLFFRHELTYFVSFLYFPPRYSRRVLVKVYVTFLKVVPIFPFHPRNAPLPFSQDEAELDLNFCEALLLSEIYLSKAFVKIMHQSCPAKT